jgi:hypothetical protein
MSSIIYEARAELAPNQPSGTADITNQLATAFATYTHIRRDLVEHLPGGGITFQTTEITSEGVVYQNNGVTVTAFLVDHGVVKPAYGYRVDYQGHSVVFSGDTTFTPNLAKYAQAADVLVHEVLLSPPGATPQTDAILSYHSTPEQAAQTFIQASPKLAVYTHIVDQTGGGTRALINRTRAAGYTGPLEVGQDLTLIEIGDSVSVLRCPSSSNPSIAAITNANYQNTISAGGTVVVWGSNFSIGGDLVFWTPATGGPTVTLSENDGLYFWDQSSGQIKRNAGLSDQAGALVRLGGEQLRFAIRAVADVCSDGELSEKLSPGKSSTTLSSKWMFASPQRRHFSTTATFDEVAEYSRSTWVAVFIATFAPRGTAVNRARPPTFLRSLTSENDMQLPPCETWRLANASNRRHERRPVPS